MFKCNLACCVFFYLFLVKWTLASRCYSDFCQNKTTNKHQAGPRCLLTSIQRGQDCINLKFHNLGHHPPPGVPLADLKLSAYVAKLPHTKLTAFNLTINSVKFRRLVTRYQNLGDEKSSHCRDNRFYDFDKLENPRDIFIACPFANSSFEAVDYRLEYLVIGHYYEYSRQLIFTVPNHSSIDENTTSLRDFKPFTYVDVSDSSMLSIFIEPLPGKFNVSKYRIWMINNDTSATDIVDLFSNDNHNHLQYDFLVMEGIYFFKVAAMHPDCGSYGCANSTMPAISTKYQNKRLFIMIISFVWIPPVILYALYYVYSFYRKRKLLKKLHRRVNCLLVYSPSHQAHVNVMSSLAKYLRSCNINAMIDVLDIPKTVNQDPGLWCNDAFEISDVIIVAASPSSSLPPGDVYAPVIYQNLDSHALRLIKENYSQRNKRYVTIELPYCNANDDIPEEARVFRRFVIPDNLNKLVRYIHKINYVQLFGLSSRELCDNINIAMTEIYQKSPIKSAINHETDDLLKIENNSSDKRIDKKKNISIMSEEKTNDKIMEDYSTPRYFNTKIEELNLLGDNYCDEEKKNSDDENKCNNYISTVDDGKFRIDQLNL